MYKHLKGQSLLALLILVQFYALASSESASAITSPEEHISLPAVDKMGIESKLKSAKTDIEKINALNELAIFYIDWEADAKVADSLLSEGIALAEMTYNNNLLLQAYANYLIVIDDYNYAKKAEAIIEKLNALGGQFNKPEDNWKCKYALAKGYQLIFKMESARDYAYQALTLAIQSKDQATIVETHLTLGDIQQKMNNNVEAIRNYLDALTIAEAEQNVILRMDCYHRLSNFYNLIKAWFNPL